MDDLLNCLSEILPEYSNVIIMGDFNFHYNNLEDPLIYVLDDSLHALGLDQLVEEPTHKDGNILDLVIAESWNSSRNYTVKVGEFLSDHKFVTIHMDLLKETTPLVYTKSRNIRDIDIEAFKSKLELIDLDSRNGSMATDLANEYDKLTLDLLNEFAPIKNRLVRDRPPKPWFDSEINVTRKAYRKLHAIWSWTCTNENWLAVKKSRNTYVNQLNKAKMLYYSELVLNAKGDAKKLFNKVNGLTNRVKANPLPDTYMEQELADHFSDYFHNKIKAITDKMQHILNYTPPIRDVPKLSCFNELNKDDICTIMSKLGLKQCEQDTLPISIIWQCEPIVQEYLLTIINTSLKSGHFPQTWKQALVKPIIKNPKMGTPDKNYRPVSNLKYFSKILECAALQQIVDHCECNNLLPRYQSAY